jgi:uncharacterized protein (DUF1800 family)
MADRVELAHLLRRATFGPTAEEVDAAERVGLDATVEGLLGGLTAGAPWPALGKEPAATRDRAARQQANKVRRQQGQLLLRWWLDQMVAGEDRLGEKLLFFWHGHWATSSQKVKSANLMLSQLKTLRAYGAGRLVDLTDAMVRDPALIVWLDGQRNTRKAPNENLARELMELFTLGPGNYTEADVKAGARALTGWTVDRVAGTATLAARRHDPGPVTILAKTGAFDVRTYAELLAAQPAAQTFVAGRLWLRFAGAVTPQPEDVRGTGITPVLRALFTARAFAQTGGQLVKQPVEWAVGAMRQLGVRPSRLPEQRQRQIIGGLQRMDQVPLRPPSVGGWPSGAAWLTTASLQARMRLAQQLANAASPTVTQRLAAAPTAGRVDALARLLVVDEWSERTRSALKPLAGQPERLIAAGLVSPEYTVS